MRQSLRKDLENTGLFYLNHHLFLTDFPPPPDPSVVREKFVRQVEAQPQPVHFTPIGEVKVTFLTTIMYTKEQKDNIEVAEFVQ